MKQGILALLVLALMGCQTIKEHPRAAAVVGAVLITSVALSANKAPPRGYAMSEPLIATPSVDCTKVSCQ